jgi:hypothetical protein
LLLQLLPLHLRNLPVLTQGSNTSARVVHLASPCRALLLARR